MTGSILPFGAPLRQAEEALASRDLARVLPAVMDLRRLALGGDANAMKLLSTGAAHAQAGQVPRVRMCAIHALRAVAAQQPAWAGTILLDNRLACNALLEDPATADAGLLGAVHVEHAENALAQMVGSQNAMAVQLLGSAVSSLGKALTATGLCPGPDAFLLDPPGQPSAQVRTELELRIAKLKASLADHAHAVSKSEILKEALNHTHTVLNHMPDDAPNNLRFRAHLWQAEILARLGKMDTGYEGSVMLTDALDAFAMADTLLDGSSALQRAGLWTAHGSAHETLGHRTHGKPAVAHFSEAARLFEASAALMVETQAAPAEQAASFIHLGHACATAACYVIDDTQAPAWLDRAVQAFTAALQTLGAGQWPSLMIEARDGLAATHEQRFMSTGDRAALTDAIGARRGILDQFDPVQTPVEWALAAVALGQAEQVALDHGGSAAIGRAALDRLRQARQRLVTAGAAEAAQRCDELAQAIRTRIAALGGG